MFESQAIEEMFVLLCISIVITHVICSPTLSILHGSASAPEIAVWVDDVCVQVNDCQHDGISRQSVVVAAMDHECEISDHILKEDRKLLEIKAPNTGMTGSPE